MTGVIPPPTPAAGWGHSSSHGSTFLAFGPDRTSTRPPHHDPGPAYLPVGSYHFGLSPDPVFFANRIPRLSTKEQREDKENPHELLTQLRAHVNSGLSWRGGTEW